jgi:hypothetical protein
MAATSTSILANGFASSVCRRINSIYHCRIVGTLPSMKSIPGTYSKRKIVRTSRRYYARLRQCHGTIRIEHGSSRPLRRKIRESVLFYGNRLDSMAEQNFQGASIAQDVRKSHHRRPPHCRPKFTIGSFNEHFRECGNIRHGKHHLS